MGDGILLASLTVLILFFGVRGNIFSLERAFPTSHPIRLDELRAQDSLRHAHLIGRIINVSLVHPKYYPHSFGVYLTKIKLGSPPREFYVLFDTGSDLIWVSCRNCNVCPSFSNLGGVPYNLYDYANSSTAGLVPCSAPMCNNKCSRQSNHCKYNMVYGGGDHSAGYYISDELHLDMIPMQSHTKLRSSASVIFGCSTYVSGILAGTQASLNGILGFSQGAMSFISQLSSQGTTPSVFSHCLKGDDSGGSILVLGEVLEPNIMYTPLVQTKNSYYSINLQSISVNGQILPIDPRAFEDTIVDSGTMLAHLAEEAYNPFIAAVTLAARKSAAPQFSNRTQCYLISTSTVAEAFPRISLHFDAGALMVLEPHQYLIQTDYDENVWCIGFTKAEGGTKGLTVLGDLVLKDKIVVYDLENQRLGGRIIIVRCL